MTIVTPWDRIAIYEKTISFGMRGQVLADLQTRGQLSFESDKHAREAETHFMSNGSVAAVAASELVRKCSVKLAMISFVPRSLNTEQRAHRKRQLPSFIVPERSAEAFEPWGRLRAYAEGVCSI